MPRISRVSLTITAAFALCPAFGMPLSGPLPGSPTEAPLFAPIPQQALEPGSNPAAQARSRGFEAIKAGKLDAAEAALHEAIKLDPSSPMGYIGMAELAAQRRQQTQVEPWLKKALAADPNGADTLRVWGRWLFQQKRYAEAEATFKKAVAAGPEAVDTRLNLGEVQLRGLKNAKAAEATFRSAVEKNPRHVGAQLALAAALAVQGRAGDAVAAFEQAVRIAPSDPEPLLSLARYQASRGQIDTALAVLDRLIAAIPSAGQAYLDRGDLLELKSDLAGAMNAYQAMTKAVPPPTSAAGHFRLATLHEAQQQWAQAESAYRAAIQAEPDFYAAHNNLAYMLAERRQQLDEALRLATRAVSLAPKVATGLDTLGWVQRARGNLDLAAKSIAQAVELQPRNPTLHYHLGIVLAEQGRKAEAAAALKRALDIDAKFKHADDARERLKQLPASR